MSWPVRDSQTVYDNAWITVREDQVTRPDGTPGIYGVVELKHPAVFIVALDDTNQVLFVQLNRHTVGSSWEIPAGGSDGEAPEVAARRELLEETGLIASQWIELGRMNALNGICRAPEIVFLARGLSESGSASDTQHEEGISALRWIPIGDALALSLTNEISDGESIAALAMAVAYLGAAPSA